ncbi:hypothetical protein [Kocuria sp. HSID16901]|uniref:hypothetical protein n=1 Tax=Kocuria sp. HSID16901 TaxID=2419505 RepID=UPI000F8688B3|nr:hypothetical protein [Kocuria sp. HSID16901]RUQ19582.1 hypothetical protein D8M21_11240 [Kocuria sp. HSID16901]
MINLDNIRIKEIEQRNMQVEIDQVTDYLSKNWRGGDLYMFDDNGESRSVRDQDFWTWRDDLLAESDQNIDDIEKLMTIEELEG